MTSRLRDFVRMNPPTFLFSMVGEDPKAFLDELYKIVHAIGVSFRDKAELASYLLKAVAKVWYTQRKCNTPNESCPILWEDFMEAFLGKCFLHENKEVKIEEFINLMKGKMSVEEYSLMFTLLFKYALSFVSNPIDEISRF